MMVKDNRRRGSGRVTMTTMKRIRRRTSTLGRNNNNNAYNQTTNQQQSGQWAWLTTTWRMVLEDYDTVIGPG